MQGLTPELYTRCRAVFRRCWQFQSHSKLRTLFVAGPLFAFRIGLPHGDTTAELIDRCLDYLIDQRLSSNGKPVLPVFVGTLRNRYEVGDNLRDELNTLYLDIKAEMEQGAAQSKPPQYQATKLFDMLLKLNFRQQVRMAQRVIQHHPVAAFLVQGESNFGQQVLVNRLLRLSPGWQTAQRVVVNLSSPAVGKDVRCLWRQVAQKLGLTHRATSSEITARVCQALETEDVIFVFHTVDYMPPEFLPEWGKDFWRPLMQAAQNNVYRMQHPTHLLMFLVDYSGCVCRWDVPLAEKPEPPDYPHHPLSLPPVDPIPEMVIDIWIDMAADILPAGLTAQTVLELSEDGIPQYVYHVICDHCGLSWEGDMIQWLT